MKDKYIRPRLKSIEILPTTLFAASFSTNNKEEDNVVAGANKRNPQQWDDIWNDNWQQ